MPGTNSIHPFLAPVFNKHRSFRNVLFGAGFLLGSAVYGQTSVNIEGNVKNSPHGVFPLTEVVAQDAGSGEVYQSVFTDVSGDYSLEFIITGLGESFVGGNVVRPNPFGRETVIVYNAVSSGVRDFSVSNVLGQEVFSSSFVVDQGGVASINVRGLGEPGLYFAVISGGSGKDVFKLVQTESDASRVVDFSVSSGFSLKQGFSNDIKLSFLGDGHYVKDTLLSQQNHFGVDVTLLQVPEQVNSLYSINLLNDVMQQPVVGGVSVRDFDSGELLFSGSSNSSGNFSRSFPVSKWSWPGLEPIYSVNALETSVSAAHHDFLQRVDDYAEVMNLSSVLSQVWYNSNASLSVNLTSLPLGYGPSGVFLDVLHNGSSVVSGSTSNGSASFNFGYDFVQNGSQVMNFINGVHVTSLDVSASHALHEPGVFSKVFSNNMVINETLNQIPEQGTTEITTNVTSVPFNYGPTGAVVLAQNPGNGSTLYQGSTVDGVHVGSFDFLFWEYGDLFQSTVDDVALNVSFTNHTSFNGVVPNESQTIPVTLQQVPVNLVSSVSGHVSNASNGAPLNQVLVEALNPGDEVISQTSSNAQGNHSQSVNYTFLEHPTNPSLSIANPAYIKLRHSLEDFVTVTSGNLGMAPSIVHNQAMQPESVETHSFSIHPYTVLNQQMSELSSQQFKFFVRTTSDNVVHEFSQVGNNPVSFVFENYSGSEVVKLWNNNPEGKLDQTIVLEYPGQVWTAPNIAQNSIVRNWFPGMPMDTLTTTLGNLSNPAYASLIEAYSSPQELWSTTPQVFLTFSGNEIMTMLADRTGYTNTIKNWKYEPVPHLDRVIFTFRRNDANPWDNSTPITPGELQAINTVAQNIDQYLTSASGRVRLPVNYNYVNNQADAQEFIDRDWDYTSRVWYQIGSPLNGVTLDPQNYRIKTSHARFPPQSIQGDIYEEIFEYFLASGNAPNSLPSKYYTVTNVGSNIVPNDVGRAMIVMASMLNPFTPVLLWNQATNSFEHDVDLKNNYEDSLMIENPFIKDLDFENKDKGFIYSVLKKE